MPGVDDIVKDVPEMCVEYINDISDFLKTPEAQYLPEYGYMKKQRDINEKMRAILIDWLIEVHYKFRLKEETLFITANIIDRYLSTANVKRQVLQLVGVTAMLIASKYEDIYPPPLHDFVYITDNAYTGRDIVKMEYDIIKELQFNLTTPSAYTFMNRYSRVAGADSVTHSLALYLIELPLIEYRMLKYEPSMVAAAAIYVAFHVLKTKINWQEKMASYTGYTEGQIRNCSKDLCILFHGINKINL
jgi:cyclin B